jgi:MFS family permease
LGIFSRELLAPYNFAGAYVAIGALSAISLIPIWLLDIPRPTAKQLSGPVRPLSEILRQPACAAAILSGTVGFSVMSMTMTATPIWMVACGFQVDTTTFVIQWHVLAMFVPAFFTGQLIARFGVLTIINTGIVLFAGAIVAAVTGITLINFTVALILLGIAWSFMYIGGSALLTRTYEPAEQAKVQGFNELMIFVGSIVASVSAGGLLTWFGWNTINFVVIPFLLITVVATIWAAKARPVEA